MQYLYTEGVCYFDTVGNNRQTCDYNVFLRLPKFILLKASYSYGQQTEH